jgi:hypothetical protein
VKQGGQKERPTTRRPGPPGGQDRSQARRLEILLTSVPSRRPVGPRFVECDRGGKSVKVGEWEERPDGLLALVIDPAMLEWQDDAEG